jgi:hypothetical protein
VADLLSGVSFILGFVGAPAVPAPDAAPAGEAVGVVVADLFSGPGFVLGFAMPEGDSFAPLGNADPPFMPGRVLSAGSVVGDTLVCNVVCVVPF